MLGRFFRDIKKYRSYLIRSVKADLKAEVADSYLNWIWWILEPLCFGFIYYFVFGFVFSAKEDYFAAFILLGLTAWTFFSNTVKSSVRLMKNNKAVVSKVYMPKHVLILNRMGVNGFKAVISFVIAIITMIALRVPITWRVVLIIPIGVLLLLVTFNVSCFLMHFGVYVADLHNVVNILLKVLFYLTGIFYNVSKRMTPAIGETGSRIVENANPMAFIICGIRKVMLYGETPDLWCLLGWLAIAVIMSILGIRVIYKNENSYVKSI